MVLPEDPKSRDPKDPKVEKLKYFTKIPQQLKERDKNNQLSLFREHGYDLLFSKDKKFNYNIDDEGFYKLLTIPRFYLKALDKRPPEELENYQQELENYQPMKPELKIRVKIYVRNYDNNEYIRSAALFLKAMLVTMKYLGIGSASNRGFGRFKLESIVKFNPKLKDYIIKGFSKECLNMCKESCKNSESNSFPVFPEAEKIKFNVSSEINNVTIDTNIDPKDIKLIRFVKPVNSRRVKISNFNCYNVKAKDIEGVLAAIGLATLKLTWKSERICKEKRIIGGRNYHTWPLGLPRSKSKKNEKKNGYLVKVNNKQFDIGRRQSYIIISPTEDLGVYLLPFYADDYRPIMHIGYKKDEVKDIEPVYPKNCNNPNKKKDNLTTKDFIDITMDWLEAILRGDLGS